MSKIVTFSPEARTKLIEGVNILSNAVGATLGPKGRNVVIAAYGVPVVTKDGVTVAQQTTLIDPIQNLGASIIKQAAAKTATIAGDGTTTSTVIAQALVNEGQALIDLHNVSPIDIKRGYEDCLKHTLNYVNDISQPVTMENVRQIATISANNDPHIGDLIHEGFSFVGTDGLIALEESKTSDTYVTTISGTSIDTGVASPYFINDPVKRETVYENPLFFITDKKVRSTSDVIPALEIAHAAKRPLIIIADEVETQALGLLVVNKVKAGLRVAAVRAPGFGERRAEILKDLALLTGATLITESQGFRFEDITLEGLGSSSKIVITDSDTLIIEPKGNVDLINERKEELKGHLSEHKPDSYSATKLNERLAMLSGKVALLHVGAATETEAREKKDRIDDALRATKSAIQKGYVVGGGLALYKAGNLLVDTDSYIHYAFMRALSAPINLILKNANLKFVLDNNKSLNALTGELVDFEEAGIIDPTLVITEAVTNAVSAANMILLSEVTIHDTIPQYDPRQGTGIDPYDN